MVPPISRKLEDGFGFWLYHALPNFSGYKHVQTYSITFNYNMDKTTTQYPFSTPLLFLFGSSGSHSLTEDASELLEHPEGKRAQK